MKQSPRAPLSKSTLNQSTASPTARRTLPSSAVGDSDPHEFAWYPYPITTVDDCYEALQIDVFTGEEITETVRTLWFLR